MIRHFIAVLVATFGSILFTTIYLALDQQISVYPPHPLLIVAGAGFVFNLLIMKSRRLAFSTKERNWSMLLMGIFNITTLLSLFIFNRLTIEPLSIFILVISIVVIVVYLIAQFESLESKLMEGEELLGTFDTVRVVKSSFSSWGSYKTSVSATDKGFIMATNIFGITTYWMSIKLYYNEEDLLSDKKNQIKKLVSELQRERDFIQFNVSALGMKNLIAFKLYQPELVSIFEIENDAKGHT